MNVVELPNQNIYLNEYGSVDIAVATQINCIKSDLIISNKLNSINAYFDYSYLIDKWYLRYYNNIYYSGFGSSNERII